MMIDRKGCALILLGLVLFGFVGGLLADWLGGPTWSPIAGALVPIAAVVALVPLLLLVALARGMGRRNA